MNDVPARHPPLRRLDYLDGLRGLAALMVVQHHFLAAFLPMAEPRGGFLTNLLRNTPLRVLLNGGFCVCIFFVLSGFVLSESTLKGKGTFLGRIVARYFRLTVPMLASLVFAWLLLFLFRGSVTNYIAVYPNTWLQEDFYGADFPGFSKAISEGVYGIYWKGHSYFNGVVWTMRKELIGSMVIYVIYCFVSARFLQRALLLFVGVTILGPFYLGFPLGALLREAWAKDKLPHQNWVWAALILGLTIPYYDEAFYSSLFGGNNVRPGLLHYNFGAFFYTIGAGLFVFSVLTLPVLREVLAKSVLRFLGRISFALYLIHLPLISSFFTWLALRMPESNYPKIGLLWIAFMITTITLAWLMTVVLDEPLMRQLKALKNLRLGGPISKWINANVLRSKTAS